MQGEDMLELTEDQDIILGNESSSRASFLNLQAVPEDISYLSLSKLLGALGTDSVSYTFYIKGVF